MLPATTAQAVGDIIDQQITKAFDDGYKAGVLAWKPEADYWKVADQKDQSEKARSWLNGVYIGTGVGLLVSIGLVLAGNALHVGTSR